MTIGVANAAQEKMFVIRAMRVSTLPKLTFDDVDRFNRLMLDVFPGAKMSDVTDDELGAAIKQVGPYRDHDADDCLCVQRNLRKV